MTRRAYLIGGTHSDPKRNLFGIARDIALWRKFLTSSYGGGWRDIEISDLSGESRSSVLTEIANGAIYDYTVICFVGHGYITKDEDDDYLTMVELNENEELSEYELNTGSPRCLALLDCCTKAPLLLEKLSFAPDSLGLNLVSAAREKYDREVMRSERGIVRVYGADLHESAADKKSFTRQLISSAIANVTTTATGVLYIDEAVELARRQMEPQQHPEYNGGRRLHHFPFAVSPTMVVG